MERNYDRLCGTTTWQLPLEAFGGSRRLRRCLCIFQVHHQPISTGCYLLSCWLWSLSVSIKKRALRQGSASEIRSFSWSSGAGLFMACDGPLFFMFFSLIGLFTWRPDGFTCSVTGPLLSILAAVRRSLTVF